MKIKLALHVKFNSAWLIVSTMFYLHVCISDLKKHTGFNIQKENLK